MDFIKWLYPGIGVKRWLLMVVAGFIFLAISISLITSYGILGLLEFKIKYFIVNFLGMDVFWGGLFFLVLGITFLIIGFVEVIRARSIYQEVFLKKGPKIVVIGGGTGLAVLLRGLKEYTNNITAIVSVADDGGSSGRLRSQLGMLPPGDIRNCLVALADREVIMEEMFNYRFKQGQDLEGHNLGNLILAAMVDIYGNFEEAIRQTSKVLAIRGKVVPSTLEHLVLRANLEDGSIIVGESNIGKTKSPIKKINIIPALAKPVEEALEAIDEADAIIFGPGSLYTSIIPNLLVQGIPEAIKASPATKIYVCNVMTQPGETTGYTASQHLQALIDHGGKNIIEYILLNNQPISDSELRDRYFADNAEQVEVDHSRLARIGVKVVEEEMLDENALVRHNPDRLARAIIKLLLSKKGSKLSFFERFILLEKIKDKE